MDAQLELMVEKLELSLGSESVGPSGAWNSWVCMGLTRTGLRPSTQFSRTQRLEMKTLFGWGLKGGRETVEPVSDVGCLKIRDRAQIRLSPACTSKGQPGHHLFNP